jgi:hypothetical protein
MNYQYKYLKYKSKYLEIKYGYRVKFKIDNNNNDLYYKQKYLKYKSKYLDIKKQQKGGVFGKIAAASKSAANYLVKATATTAASTKPTTAASHAPAP